MCAEGNVAPGASLCAASTMSHQRTHVHHLAITSTPSLAQSPLERVSHLAACWAALVAREACAALLAGPLWAGSPAWAQTRCRRACACCTCTASWSARSGTGCYCCVGMMLPVWLGTGVTFCPGMALVQQFAIKLGTQMQTALSGCALAIVRSGVQ